MGIVGAAEGVRCAYTLGYSFPEGVRCAYTLGYSYSGFQPLEVAPCGRIFLEGVRCAYTLGYHTAASSR